MDQNLDKMEVILFEFEPEFAETLNRKMVD